MAINKTVAFLEAYNQLQNDFTSEDSVRVFGEGPGLNIWDKFQANNNQFPLWMLGETERRKLAEFLAARVDMNEIWSTGK